MKIASNQYGKALIDVLKETAPEKRDVVIDKFFEMLVKNNAVKQLDEILAFVERQDKEEKGFEDVNVVTAFPLTGDLRLKIIGKMESLTGRKINLNESVDKNIIGGIIIKFNDYLFDGSVRAKIAKLGKALIQA